MATEEEIIAMAVAIWSALETLRNDQYSTRVVNALVELEEAEAVALRIVQEPC